MDFVYYMSSKIGFLYIYIHEIIINSRMIAHGIGSAEEDEESRMKERVVCSECQASGLQKFATHLGSTHLSDPSTL